MRNILPQCLSSSLNDVTVITEMPFARSGLEPVLNLEREKKSDVKSYTIHGIILQQTDCWSQY